MCSANSSKKLLPRELSKLCARSSAQRRTYELLREVVRAGVIDSGKQQRPALVQLLRAAIAADYSALNGPPRVLAVPAPPAPVHPAPAPVGSAAVPTASTVVPPALLVVPPESSARSSIYPARCKLSRYCSPCQPLPTPPPRGLAAADRAAMTTAWNAAASSGQPTVAVCEHRMIGTLQHGIGTQSVAFTDMCTTAWLPQANASRAMASILLVVRAQSLARCQYPSWWVSDRE